VVEVSNCKVPCFPVLRGQAKLQPQRKTENALLRTTPVGAFEGQDSKLFRAAISLLLTISLDTISAVPLGYVAAVVPENINPETFSRLQYPRNLVSRLGHSCAPGFRRPKEDHFRY
jgi:hypothetical protein